MATSDWRIAKRNDLTAQFGGRAERWSTGVINSALKCAAVDDQRDQSAIELGDSRKMRAR